MKAILALEDGSWFEGKAFGAEGLALGEVVFNTSMTGYPEILTDPSYRGQIVTLTYPHIGNYGICSQDAESIRPALAGLVVREACPQPSNWRTEEDLPTYLRRHGVVGIHGIDTRALTRRLRLHGSLRGVVATGNWDPRELVGRARSIPPMEGQDLVQEVTCEAPFTWEEGIRPVAEEGGVLGDGRVLLPAAPPPPHFHVVAYDFGIKRNILRMLVTSGCRVTVVPAHTPAEEVLSLQPDGIFLSNGPGDPAAVTTAIRETRHLIGRRPLFGICLGHQILALALGGRTYKLKFGHHGANQPVKDLQTGRVEITAQNHGFAVDPDSLGESVEITHINLNDQTVEGLRHRELPLFSVQYHPEAAPGPHDSWYLFARFVALMRQWREATS